MKIDRLIGIITILLQQDKVTAPELAQRFEVSRRTINRDIETICKAGIPLVTIQGFNGGISVSRGYKIDKALFNRDELGIILTGLKGIDTITENSYLTKVAEKLSGREHQIHADDTIMIDLASHYQETLRQKIDLIRRAIRQKCIVFFQYYSEKGEGLRRMEPYRLVFKWSSWYVFGYCQSREDFRLFKLNRLWNLECTEELFIPRQIPDGALDFDDYFCSQTIPLKAEFSEKEKYRLIDEYGVDCYTPGKNGSLLFEWNFASYENMKQWILSFGDQVRVLEPENLQEDIRRQSENILRKYQEVGE